MRKEALHFCDNVSDKYKSMNTSFSINANQFIRTTSWRHICVVGWLWRRLERNGSIYIGEHEGWYCQSDEAFLTDIQVVTRREYLASTMKMNSVNETNNGKVEMKVFLYNQLIKSLYQI
jgi:methionyl-tRNA synthetase